MKCSTYSLDTVFQLRSKAFAKISQLAFQIDALAAAIIDVDAAVLSASERNIDEQHALVTAARRLADLLAEGGAAQ